MLHPRAAAKWLLSRPKRRDLVPPGLKAFLERTERHEEREVPALGPVEHERLLAQSRAAATFSGSAILKGAIIGTHGFSNRCPSIRLRTSCRCIAPRTPARLLFRSTACRCQRSTDTNGRFRGAARGGALRRDMVQDERRAGYCRTPPGIRHCPLWQLRWVKGATLHCFPEKPSRGCVATQSPDISCPRRPLP